MNELVVYACMFYYPVFEFRDILKDLCCMQIFHVFFIIYFTLRVVIHVSTIYAGEVLITF